MTHPMQMIFQGGTKEEIDEQIRAYAAAMPKKRAAKKKPEDTPAPEPAAPPAAPAPAAAQAATAPPVAPPAAPPATPPAPPAQAAPQTPPAPPPQAPPAAAPQPPAQPAPQPAPAAVDPGWTHEHIVNAANAAIENRNVDAMKIIAIYQQFNAVSPTQLAPEHIPSVYAQIEALT